MAKKQDSNKSMHGYITALYDRVPETSKQYRLPTKDFGYIEITNKEDKAIFADLYAPAGAPKTTGNGEAALFWLLNCDKSNIKNFSEAGTSNRCQANQGGDTQADPDLMVKVGGEKRGMEVKSLPAGAFFSGGGTGGQTQALGRFGRFSDFIAMVGFLQSVDNLIGEKAIAKDIATLKNVSYEKLTTAAENFCLLRSIILKNRLQEYTIFQKMAENFDLFDKIASKHDMLKACTYEGPTGSSRVGGEEIAERLLAFLAETAIGEKPGYGNYMVNVPDSSSTMFKIEVFRPQKASLNTSKVKKTANFKIDNGSIKLKFGEMFS